MRAYTVALESTIVDSWVTLVASRTFQSKCMKVQQWGAATATPEGTEPRGNEQQNMLLLLAVTSTSWKGKTSGEGEGAGFRITFCNKRRSEKGVEVTRQTSGKDYRPRSSSTYFASRRSKSQSLAIPARHSEIAGGNFLACNPWKHLSIRAIWLDQPIFWCYIKWLHRFKLLLSSQPHCL